MKPVTKYYLELASAEDAAAILAQAADEAKGRFTPDVSNACDIALGRLGDVITVPPDAIAVSSPAYAAARAWRDVSGPGTGGRRIIAEGAMVHAMRNATILDPAEVLPLVRAVHDALVEVHGGGVEGFGYPMVLGAYNALPPAWRAYLEANS